MFFISILLKCSFIYFRLKHNDTLNYLISGDFNKGIPLGKVTVFAGESGAGKSFIAAGNVVNTHKNKVSMLS